MGSEQDFDDDALASDDSRLERVVAQSLRNRSIVRPVESAISGPSGSRTSGRSHGKSKSSILKKSIKEIDNKISQLQKERDNLYIELEEELKAERDNKNVSLPVANGKGKGKTTINYDRSDFAWSGALKDRLLKVFGHQNFRPEQEAICNASMDGQDVITVMPTAAGKSLTYQLPALFFPGLTIVISPLVSLMNDQVSHLLCAGIRAVMLSGAVGNSEKKRIIKTLFDMGEGSSTNQDEIKLLYLSPEMFDKNKTLISALGKLNKSGKLARVVIDEAHCISQDGHDFRPDYLKLSGIRRLWPDVPISALSATCPFKVLKDIHATLQLRKLVDGRNSMPGCTSYFSAPPYRKNLHYKVLPKGSTGEAAKNAIRDYIQNNHSTHSGLVYCSRIKDTDEMADFLNKCGIKTGAYHSDRSDKDKLSLYEKWSSGEIQVICATIAFGLGIDKGAVRFVIHQSIAKSVEGFYQESGRAGRDGEDADCVLYYRPQDGLHLSTMVYKQRSGIDKVYAMMKFAQDVEQCRKIAFAEYFSMASALDTQFWSTHDTDGGKRCGHCDNCLRPPESIEKQDVTLAAWQLLKLVDNTKQNGALLTFAELVKVARGNKNQKVVNSMKDLTGSNVVLSSEHTEKLVAHLLIAGYLEEEFKGNSYTVWSCLRTKSAAVTKQLLNLSREEVEQGKGRKIQLSFVVVAKSRRPVSRKAPSLDQRVAASTPQVETSSSKRKRSGTAKPKAIDTPTRFVKQTNPMNDERLHDSESDFVPSDEDSEVEWMHTMGQVSAGVPLSQKRRRLPHQSFDVDNDDVIILSD